MPKDIGKSGPGGLPRRTFLTRALALTLGVGSGAAALYAVFRGRSIDRFLSRGSAAVLERFGSGRDLVEALELDEPTQRALAERIAELRSRFDAKSSLFKRGDFTAPLRQAAQSDYKAQRVIVVNGWVLSQTEVGIFFYNAMKRRRLI